MAVCALLACAEELYAAGHGDHPAGHVLQPLFRPWRVPLHSLFPQVLSVRKTMARKALTDHAGELLAAGNGEPPWLPLFPAGALSLSFPSLIGAIRP